MSRRDTGGQTSESLVNKILRSGFLRRQTTTLPPSSLRFGVCTTPPQPDGRTEVILDGDFYPMWVRSGTGCNEGDKVVVALIGNTRVTLTWLDPPA